MKPGNFLPHLALLLAVCAAAPAQAGISGMMPTATAIGVTPEITTTPVAAQPRAKPREPVPTAVHTEDLKRCYGLNANDDKLQCYMALTIRALPSPPVAVNAPGSVTAAALAGSNAVGSVVAATLQNPAEPSEAERERIKQHQAFIDLRKIILDHQEPSYFNFSSGVRLANDKATSNLLYEAQIVKNVAITNSAQIGDYSHFFWIDAPVRIGVRQQTGPSLPVRTPSFNPGLRLTWAPRLLDNYFTAGLHHYSNGQDNKSTLDDGRINTQNGSFNTNYIELAAQNHDSRNPLDKNWYRIAFRQHLYGTFESFQHGQYPRQQLIFGVHHTRKSFRLPLIGYAINEVQLRLTSTLGLGYQYLVRNDIHPEQNRIHHNDCQTPMRS